MKKKSLLWAILIVVAIFMLLTWIIPTGIFTNKTFVSSGHSPMGIFDFLMLPFTFFSWTNVMKVSMTDGLSAGLVSSVSTILGILSIGIFYKVLNKTGAYGKIIEKIVNKLTDNKVLFVIISIVLFTLLSSLTGLSLLLFLLVPFFVTILTKLKFSRITSLASTVLPILIGRVCSITAWDVTGINNAAFGISWNDNIVVRIIILILFMVLTTLYVVISKSPTDENNEDPMYDENVKMEKSPIPLVVLTSIFFIVMAVCMYNWYYVFNNTGITDAYERIMSNSINGYPFVNNLLGTIEPFGYWSGFTMSAMLLLLSLILTFIYSISFDDFIKSVKDGIKGMGKVAIYIVLASLVTTYINELVYAKAENSNIFFTMAEWINKNISFETIPFSSLMSGIYGIFINDYSSVALQATGYLGIYFVDGAYSLAVLCFQTVYGIMGLIAPTSIFLVAGLAYLDIPYKKWLSYIWKLFLSLLVLALLILLIVSIL